MCYAPAHNASPASILLSVIVQTASFSRGLRTAVALRARSTELSGLHMRSALDLSKDLEVLHRQNDRVGSVLGIHRMTDARDQPENHTDQSSGQGLHGFTPA